MVQCPPPLHLRPPWWNRRLPFSSFLSLPRRVNRPCRPKPRIIAIESPTLYKCTKYCHQHCTSVQSTVTNTVQVYRVYKSLYNCTKHWVEIYFNFSTAESSRAPCSHSIVDCFALSPRDVIIFSTLSLKLSPTLSTTLSPRLNTTLNLHWARLVATRSDGFYIPSFFLVPFQIGARDQLEPFNNKLIIYGFVARVQDKKK